MDLNRFLRVPAALIAANWAGLLAVVVLGLVPAAAGTQRVMSRFDEHADESGTVVLRQLRTTWWRDLPVSLGMLAYVVVAAATVALVVGPFAGSTRVFFAGLLVPVYWVVGAAIAAYIRAAAILPLDASRGEVLDAAIELALRHPLRALLTVPVTLLTAPTYVLPPLTIACGLSVPAWALDQVWRAFPAAAGGRSRMLVPAHQAHG